MMFQISHINYPLVEDVRPPIYTAMKYWGKKPHNIWATFIKSYCPPNGFVLDPFVGSGIAAFEAVRLGRKALAFDLNPLTSFIIEVLSSQFDEKRFLSAVKAIDAKLQVDPVYVTHYVKTYAGKNAVVYNYRWLGKEVDKVAIETSSHAKLLVHADSEDKKNAVEMQTLTCPYWYPQNPFPQTPSIKHKFIRMLGEAVLTIFGQRETYICWREFSMKLISKQIQMKT